MAELHGSPPPAANNCFPNTTGVDLRSGTLGSFCHADICLMSSKLVVAIRDSKEV